MGQAATFMDSDVGEEHVRVWSGKCLFQNYMKAQEDLWKGVEIQYLQHSVDIPFLAPKHLGCYDGIALHSPNQCSQFGFPEIKQRICK